MILLLFEKKRRLLIEKRDAKLPSPRAGRWRGPVWRREVSNPERPWRGEMKCVSGEKAERE